VPEARTLVTYGLPQGHDPEPSGRSSEGGARGGDYAGDSAPPAGARGRRLPVRWAAGLAGVGVAAVVAISGYVASTRSAPPTLDPQRVVVAPFENRTGQSTLDPVGSMAADWIIQGLSLQGWSTGCR
jgi:hypothetical protein